MSVLQGSVYVAQLVSDTDLTGASVTATVTDPNGGITNLVATVAGKTASAVITATIVGTYLIVWATTGTVVGAVQDQFSVVPPTAALMSLPDLKEELNLNPADTSKDGKLRRWLASATSTIEHVTGPIRPHTEVDIFDGGSPYVVLNARWLSAVTSVVMTQGGSNTTLTEQTLGAATGPGYTWDRDTNTVTRRDGSGGATPFADGFRNVTVTYTAGLATIPDDVQLACAELIRHWYQKNEVAYRGSYGGYGGGQPPADDMMMVGNYLIPNAVMEVLEPWRRPPGIY